MTEKYDLHCHSRLSDGTLSPAELIQRAVQKGVTTLALTDHDTTSGYDEAQATAAKLGIRLIAGIELSVSWRDKALHILGLDIDPKNTALQAEIQQLQVIRTERAQKISAKLEKKRIFGAFEAVTQAAGDSMITRTHFADFLLSQLHVTSQQDAFDRYLAQGKSAYVPTIWTEMETAIQCITGAGGIAVLAHPLRYKLTASWMKRLLTVFKQAGGQGIEVVTGRSNADEIKQVANYAMAFELTGSIGSDFHDPANQWVELGRLAALPDSIKPVWELFEEEQKNSFVSRNQ